MSLKRRLERATRRAGAGEPRVDVIDFHCYPPALSDQPYPTIVCAKWEGGRWKTGCVAPDEAALRQ